MKGFKVNMLYLFLFSEINSFQFISDKITPLITKYQVKDLDLSFTVGTWDYIKYGNPNSISKLNS